MPRRPLIGLAVQSLPADGERPPCWIMGQRYVRALAADGAIPWVIPLLPDDEPTLRAIYERLDGVFLTGGVDVEPARYGEPRHEKCGAIDPPRDATELALARWALADGKPFLGVCRGVQVLNVAAGGTLYQDVGTQRPESLKHDCFPSVGGYTRTDLTHAIAVRSGTRLGHILGSGDVPVNSMHHQGIKDLAPGLIATAHAPDGLVEGVEAPNGHFAVGVQWHPEELTETSPPMRRLFAAFLEAARLTNSGR